MYCFFCPTFKKDDKYAFVSDPKELHHLKNVLRLKVRNSVQFLNGKGIKGEGFISSLDEKQAKITVTKTTEDAQSHTYITLACAIPKKSKFELIIEKATELGVDEIIPLITKRTEFKLEGDRLNKKLLRYQAIAQSAAKQSKRSAIPKVTLPTSLKDVLDALNDSQGIIPSLEEKSQSIFTALNHVPTKNSKFTFFIGPEGDFTTQEYSLARKYKCIPVSLGPTILRVETAAICTLSAAQQYFCFKNSFQS